MIHRRKMPNVQKESEKGGGAVIKAVPFEAAENPPEGRRLRWKWAIDMRVDIDRKNPISTERQRGSSLRDEQRRRGAAISVLRNQERKKKTYRLANESRNDTRPALKKYVWG